ncbi:MAG: UDP-N-acetylmuramate--L-alanine ligase, partial [Verrucomicrobia bacterium]|nr:UDP-N-acetylmuramate--L-alanine ligase [Verrucomicrobiota bacterium]
EKNVEDLEAKKKFQPLLHRSALLQELMQDSESLLVAGTHGKTTTSSLLAHVLVSCGKDPSYCIGGVVQSLGSQAGHGKSSLFVAEADESDGSFLVYTPKGAIITNIDTDHLSYWKTEESLVQGFLDFSRKISCKDWFFWCADDGKLRSLSLGGISYGFSEKADLRIEKVTYLGWETLFSFRWKGRIYQDVKIPLIGMHNVLNASAVIGLCLQMGIEENDIFSALLTFSGALRRCEKKGEVEKIFIYDDYGHHPTEIYTTLKAMKIAGQGRRVVALFQPHRFTRTKDCFSSFGEAFSPADLVLLTDIYGAGEAPIEDITAENLYKEIVSKGYEGCRYVPKEKIVEEALKIIKPGDIVVTMGAGDITKIGPILLKRLKT